MRGTNGAVGGQTGGICQAYPGSILMTNPQQIDQLFNITHGNGVYPHPAGAGSNYGYTLLCVDPTVYNQVFGNGNGNGGACYPVCDSFGWCFCG